LTRIGDGVSGMAVRANARGSRKPIGRGGQRPGAASVALAGRQNEIAITMHSPIINAARKFIAALTTYFILRPLPCGVRAPKGKAPPAARMRPRDVFVEL
jgi:hypothetical protein